MRDQPVVSAINARTSQSHPLQIASVSAGDGLGLVGVTFCPGKKQAGALTGAWDRDLEVDVAAIAAWDAAAVVTLIEDREIKALAVREIGSTVTAHHMSWFHLPIRDVSVPSLAFEAEWRSVGPRLRSILRAGGNILVHCKGGLGRAGIVACRLLIDAGLTPEAALAAVRAVRPGAVETAAQERYVLAAEALPAPVASSSSLAVEDRAIGALLGLAVGDAVGTTLEFSTRDSKPQLADMVGGGPFGLKAGEWTDDTAMALALADSLIDHPAFNPEDLMQRFVSWQRQGTYSCTGRCFDIGVTTSTALARYRSTGNPMAGSTDRMSAGNGSLMRLSPVAIRFWQDANARRHVAAEQSCTTHAAPEAVGACVGFADLLASAIAGVPLDELMAPRDTDLPHAIAAVFGGNWRTLPRSEVKSSGYVVHSLQAAIWCVARTTDFRSAILLAANLGDDADTVAAITGQLAGAIYGASGIPANWLAKLAWRDRLESTARRLLA